MQAGLQLENIIIVKFGFVFLQIDQIFECCFMSTFLKQPFFALVSYFQFLVQSFESTFFYSQYNTKQGNIFIVKFLCKMVIIISENNLLVFAYVGY